MTTTNTATLAKLTAAREAIADLRDQADAECDAMRERLRIAREERDHEDTIAGYVNELRDLIAARDLLTRRYRQARVAELDAKADAEIATAVPMVSLSAAESVVARLAEVEAERDAALALAERRGHYAREYRDAARAAREQRDEARAARDSACETLVHTRGEVVELGRRVDMLITQRVEAERVRDIVVGNITDLGHKLAAANTRAAGAETQLNTALSILGNRANAATKGYRYACEADVEVEELGEARGRRDALTAAYTRIRAVLGLDES